MSGSQGRRVSKPISLRQITHDNLEAVLSLEVTEQQKAIYPRSNAQSIAEGHYPADDDPVWMRAIYAGDVPVGFLMTSEAPEQGDYFLWRIMIDAHHQNEGYAAKAVDKLIQRLQATANARCLITSHLADNEQAGRFFAGLGFAYTGELLGATDRVMKMDLAGRSGVDAK